MKTLAKVIVDLAGFLELSGDDVVDLDAAVAALESMAAGLANATPAERKALRTAAATRAKGERGEARAFFQSFMEAAGLDDERQPPRKATRPKPAATADRKALSRALEFGRGDAAAVKKLLAANPALLEAKLDKSDNRPLHLAALFGYTPIVEHLLALGADVNALNRHTNTPLHDAALNGHAKVAQLLLAAGANPNLKDSQGYTPLANARQSGHAAVTKLLRKHRAK
jgi:hypothetical protein